MSSDRSFRVPADLVAQEHLRNKGSDKKMFLYEFAYRGQQSLTNIKPMQLISDHSVTDKCKMYIHFQFVELLI